MAIRAMIMAGGEGVRLRPMTLPRPKPLVPMLGKPVLAYTLDLLKRHGICDVGATLCYQAKKIRAALGNGEKFGMRITCFEETAPLGTAGSIRMAMEQLDDTFFVLSGDGLTDCDLTKALAFHKEKGALATLVLKRVKVPLQYGVVMTEAGGRIVRFLEKPDWSHAYSNLVNTGIYILEKEIFEHISKEGAPDFGRDVFPALLKSGLPIYGYEMQGYWCDVGSQEAYLQAQADLLSGKANLPCERGIGKDTEIQPGAHLQGAFLIGRDAQIGSGAVIRNSVIGENCMIGSGAVIENCCLWDGVQIGPKARLEGCVACDGSIVKAGCVIRNGCTLGQGAQAGAHALIHAGVKLWPGVKVPSGAVLTESVHTGECGFCWEADGANCTQPSSACRMAAAFAKGIRAKSIITGHRDAPGMQAVVSGALEMLGVKVMQGPYMTESMLREAVVALQADGGILAVEDMLIFVDGHGNPAGNDLRRKMEGLYLEGTAFPAGKGGEMNRLDSVREIYLSRVLPKGEKRKLHSPVALFCENREILSLAAEGLERLGAVKVRQALGSRQALRPGETGFVLTDDGKKTVCITSRGNVDETRLTLLLLKLMAGEQRCLYDLPDVPRAAQQLCPVEAADESEMCLQQKRRMEDGLWGLWQICEGMKNGPVEMLLKGLPGAHIVCREVECREQDKSRILYELCKKAALPYTLDRGMQVQHEKGCATIVPDGIRPSVRIMSEAADMEAANELCDFYDREIRRTLEEKMDF